MCWVSSLPAWFMGAPRHSSGSWGTEQRSRTLFQGLSVPLSPDTVTVSRRAASVARAELIHAEEHWCDVQQFRRGVHKGV